MKKIFSAIVLFILFTAFCQRSIAQKVTSEIDKFTKSKRVSTDYTYIVNGLAQVLSLKLRSVDTSYFLTLRGNVGLGIVGTHDAVTFLFDDSTTTKIYPTSIQSYETDFEHPSLSFYTHQYNISKDQVEKISKSKIVSLRREYNDHYKDVDIKERLGKKLEQLSINFLQELNNKM